MWRPHVQRHTRGSGLSWIAWCLSAGMMNLQENLVTLLLTPIVTIVHIQKCRSSLSQKVKVVYLPTFRRPKMVNDIT